MKYQIGTFSRLSQLSAKTLRHYHEKGLLVPSEVDASNGYRLYSDADLERARVIRALKALELPLKSIAEILDKHDDDLEIVSFLEQHQREIQGQLQKYLTIQNSLDAMILQAKHWQSAFQRDVSIQEIKVPPTLFAGQRRTGPYEDIRLCFKAVGRAAGFRIAGPAIGLFYDDGYLEEGADFEGGFPVKSPIRSDEVDCREIEGGTALSIVHVGGYDSIHATYVHLFKEATRRGLVTKRPSREVYLKGPGMLFRGNPAKYRTELQVLLDA